MKFHRKKEVSTLPYNLKGLFNVYLVKNLSTLYGTFNILIYDISQPIMVKKIKQNANEAYKITKSNINSL